MEQAQNKRARFGARSANSFWKATFVSAALITAVGCGGDDGGGGGDTPVPTKDASTGTKDAGSSHSKDAGGSNSKDAGSSDTTGSVAAGLTLATKNICVSCHGADYSGAGYYPNITPDEATGIGSWTDQQIKDAIVKGVDDEGNDLCSLMQKYKFTTTDQANIVAFLRSLDAVDNEITDECPN